LVAAGAVIVTSVTGFAGDKSQSTFVNPVLVTGAGTPALVGPIGSTWTNGVSKGKTKGDDKCKVQVQLGGLTIPNTDGLPGTGDEVICTADANVVINAVSSTSTTAVFRGEVVSGKVKIKADLALEGTGCTPSGTAPPGGIAQYDGRITCYQADPTYPNPTLGFASDPTQGVYPFGFGPRPASPMIATQGLFFKP